MESDTLGITTLSCDSFFPQNAVYSATKLLVPSRGHPLAVVLEGAGH